MTFAAPFSSAFVGRQAELAEVRHLVTANRMVTVLGVGGVGKTRLGYRVLSEIGPVFGGNVWAVDLADLTDAKLLGYLVAASTGALATGGRSVAAIVEHIGERPGLVYLDNCEHLLEACAELVTELLAGCPGVHVLVSSRQAIGHSDEHVFALAPLNEADAVRLFRDRARGYEHTVWETGSIAGLCAALDRLPLAIQLAAGQADRLTPDAILGQLSVSMPGELDRSSSVDACIRWSHELCTPQEQQLWQRLSVFGGGFSDADVRATCDGDGLGPEEVVAALTGLLGKSVLEREGGDFDGRYRMLELIREFGGACLLESGETDRWRRRHRDHYLEVAEEFDSAWFGPDQTAWMDRLRRDHRNLRLAFDYSVTDPAEAPAALRMCSVLEHYFASTGGGVEAVAWLDRALAHGTGAALERAQALRVVVFVAVLQGELDTAARWYEELTALAASTDDDRVSAYARYAGGVLRTWQGDAETGAELAQEGIALLHRIGDVGREANLHFLQGMMLGWADRSDEAAAAYRRCFDLSEPAGERWLASYSAWGLGIEALLAGRSAEALELERGALEAKAAFGDQLGIGLALEALAWIAADTGRGSDAALLTGAAEAIWDAIGMTVGAMPYLVRRRELGIAQARALLTGDALADLVAQGRALPQAEAVALGLGLGR